MSYSGRINKIIASLNDRGFNKKASEVSEVKEAMLGLPFAQDTNKAIDILIPDVLGKKFAYISERLEKCGYTLLVKKFNDAVGDYKKMAAESEEVHEIPSVEQTYEKSKSPKDFGKEIKKLIGVHDKIVDLVKKFDDEYETEVLDKIDSKKLSEADAVKKTVQLVEKVDNKSDSEIDKLC